MAQTNKTHWALRPTERPALNETDKNVVNVLGGVLVLMAVLQLVSFNEFKDGLGAMGLGSPQTWAIIIIAAELIAAASMFRFRLAYVLRWLGGLLALLVAGFWFIQSLRAVIGDGAGDTNYFGKFFSGEPGWVSVLASSLLLLWAVYALEALNARFSLPEAGNYLRRR
ncbi:MAG: hypothetical protein WD887_02850 [Candidatus Saccharimonadales bacterium]